MRRYYSEYRVSSPGQVSATNVVVKLAVDVSIRIICVWMSTPIISLYAVQSLEYELKYFPACATIPGLDDTNRLG